MFLKTSGRQWNKAIPKWNKAIDTELIKFEDNNCLQYVPDTGQHLVPMMWLFSIKTDGTRKARLVGRGDLMTPLVDYDPDAVYCGNISASSIKIALTIAGMYCLVMRGGDLVGAYLITRANLDFPVFIKTSQGYKRRPGFVVQAIGNLYGFPPVGQNFSIEFDKCLEEAGYKNTPWDLKLFFKWTKA
jgi:Reverse transcriptase (RNA-dependent DNA polymerase)